MMHRSFLTIFLFLLLCDCFAQKLAITNVNVVDVQTMRTLPSRTVLIKDGIIVRVGGPKRSEAPKDYTVIDGKGKFMIPGLWDMHVHLSYYGEEALQMLVASGITSVRDMGGDLQQIDKWRNEIKEGKRVGPLIYRSGPFIDGPKKMDAQRESFTKVVKNERQGRQAVDELKKMGVDFVKVHSRVPKSAFFAIVAEAKKQMLPLAVHAPVDVPVADIAKAGVRSIEHTESLLGGAIYEKDSVKRNQLTDEAFKRLESDSVFAIIKKSGSYYDPTVSSLYLLKGTSYEKQLGPRLLPLVRKLYRAGVPIVTGSDFATKAAGIVPGRDLHRELELLVEAGMSPVSALRSATINAAKCMNEERQVGVIGQGKIANLILLDADPLSNISNTRKIYKVIVNGKVIEN